MNRKRASYTIHSQRILQIDGEFLVPPSKTWKQNYAGHTYLCTISMPMELMQYLEDIATLAHFPRSYVVGFYVHMGMLYCKQLANDYVADLDKEEDDDETKENNR